MPLRSIENEKKYKKALRFIYVYGQESNKVTPEAIEACKRQGIAVDDIILKSVDDFAVHPKSMQQSSKASPKNRHQAELNESEANLAMVRHRHHENRRKSKY